MQRRDRGLHLVRAAALVTHRLVDQREPLGDQLAVPAAAVLVFQQHDAAVRVEARGRARVLQQQQRGEAHDLGLAREQPQQQPGEPDRLVAQRRARLLRAAVGRISLVEDEVDHRGDGGEPFGPLGRARRLERDVGAADAALRSRDALLHGGLADQEGARDLCDRQAGDDAQRERDLLGRRQVGVAADEQQAQDVVAVVRAVEPLGELGFGVVQIRNDVLGRQRFLFAPAPRLIERDVAPDQDEPGGGVARRTVLRPVPQRPQARLLERFLRRVEVAEIAQQRAERPRTRRRQRRVDPRDVGHAVALPGRNSDSGRISYAPAELLARARSCAVSIAASSVEQSTM